MTPAPGHPGAAERTTNDPDELNDWEESLRNLFRWTLILITLVSLTACSDDGGSDKSGESSSDGAAAREFYVDYFKLSRTSHCRVAFNDCPTSLGRTTSSYGRSLEECIEIQHARSEAGDFSKIVAAVDSGKAVFDADAASDCLDTLQSNLDADTCYEPTLAERTACLDAIQGTVASGEPCLYASECASGTCEVSQADDICHGTCAPMPEMAAEGEDCNPPAVECDASQNLLCTTSTDENGNFSRTCVRNGSRQEGEPAAVSANCAEGFYQVDGTCMTVTASAEGESCVFWPDNAEEAAIGVCQAGFYCGNLDADDRGTCAPLGGEGETCTNEYGCIDGLYCDTDASTCVVRGELGDACESSRQCAAELDCDDETSTCTEELEQGDPCSGAFDCPIGLSCTGPEGEGTCQPFVIGDSCAEPDLGE